jgi:hypothetical protein
MPSSSAGKQLTHTDEMFQRFVARFEDYLKESSARFHVPPTLSTDDKILSLGQAHPEALEKTLREAFRVTFGQKIPETRLGDNVISYSRFVMTLLRTPKDRLMFNDVLHTIKTTDAILDPLRVFVSDKEFVKLYVRATIGDEYNVPTLSLLTQPDDVDVCEFPLQCCIKPTHASGHVILRRGGEDIDRDKIKKWFGFNYYHWSREANYKYLRPKIIVEPLVFNNAEVEDYKFFCYNGFVKLIQIDFDRSFAHKRACYDINWNQLPFSFKYPKSSKASPKPANLSEMIDIAQRLSLRFGFVRVDLYSDGHRCFVGEITNCAGGACNRFIPEDAEATASKIIFD